MNARLGVVDIDPGRPERAAGVARTLVAAHDLPAPVEAMADQRRVLDGAADVMVTFQIGGLDAYRLDVEIPRRFGVDQAVGDTLGPGGVFRFLHSAAVFRGIAADLRGPSPDALLIDNANPMAMVCWYLDRLGCAAVGLRRGIRETSRMMARRLGVPNDEVRRLAAGINHLAWLLRFERGKPDRYPEPRAEMRRRHLPGPGGNLPDPGADPEANR